MALAIERGTVYERYHNFMREHEESPWMTAAEALLPFVGLCIASIRFGFLSAMDQKLTNHHLRINPILSHKAGLFGQIKVKQSMQNCSYSCVCNLLVNLIFSIALIALGILTHPLWVSVAAGAAAGFAAVALIGIPFVLCVAWQLNGEIADLRRFPGYDPNQKDLEIKPLKELIPFDISYPFLKRHIKKTSSFNPLFFMLRLSPS